MTSPRRVRRPRVALAGFAMLTAVSAAGGCTDARAPAGGTAGAGSSGASGGPAALVVRNAALWTGSDSTPADATAIAVVGDRIAAVGTDAEIEGWIGEGTRVVDAAGGSVTPGFIDSHVHFLEGGQRLASVQLRDAATPDDFVARIAAFAETVPPGTWIMGGDWDHTNWGGELPRAAWVDSVTPDHPVWVNRLDGHMALANGAAMAAAGIDAGVAAVEGGEIVRAADGTPTGVFKDNAMALVGRAVPVRSPEDERRALDAAMAHVARQGVTAVVHMGDLADLQAFVRARDAGALTTRITACTALPDWEALDRWSASAGAPDDRLGWGCLKGFVDGSLGSHTAAFFEPFTDAPDDRGFFVSSPEELGEWTTGADARGYQVAIHAIGDRAIDAVLDVFESAARTNGPRDRRFRVEHAQHLAPGDFGRFARLGVVASMQPYHAIDDGRWAEAVIGPDRIQRTYAFRSFLDAGAHLAFGSDWFVAPPTPLDGLYAAVTRRTLDGANPDGWVPAEAITLDEALHAYTTGAAWAAFREGDLGTLEVGKRADLVVLDRDLFALPPARLRDAAVRMTVVGGEIVFEAR